MSNYYFGDNNNSVQIVENGNICNGVIDYSTDIINQSFLDDTMKNEIRECISDMKTIIKNKETNKYETAKGRANLLLKKVIDIVGSGAEIVTVIKRLISLLVVS